MSDENWFHLKSAGILILIAAGYFQGSFFHYAVVTGVMWIWIELREFQLEYKNNQN